MSNGLDPDQIRQPPQARKEFLKQYLQALDGIQLHILSGVNSTLILDNI